MARAFFKWRMACSSWSSPNGKRVFVLSGGGNRNWRLIYLDGRALPKSEDVTPDLFRLLFGHWDGDTLVVESDAFVERFWFSNGGLPHTESPAPDRTVFAAGFQYAEDTK